MRLWIPVAAALALLLAETVHAQTNWALSFDGFDDYVEVVDPIATNGPFTLEAWINVNSTEGRIISNRDGVNGYDMDVWEDELRLAFNGDLVADAPMAMLNQWVYVAATWTGPDPGTLVLYVNDDAYPTTHTGDIVAPTGTLRLGHMAVVGSFTSLDGLLDEVRVWNTVLDAGTLAAWKTRPVTSEHPNYSDLAGYWDFNEGAGDVAATQVNSPARDGQLGSTKSPDTNDPEWVPGATTPVQTLTMGRLKTSWGAPARN